MTPIKKFNEMKEYIDGTINVVIPTIDNNDNLKTFLDTLANSMGVKSNTEHVTTDYVELIMYMASGDRRSLSNEVNLNDDTEVLNLSTYILTDITDNLTPNIIVDIVTIIDINLFIANIKENHIKNK